MFFRWIQEIMSALAIYQFYIVAKKSDHLKLKHIFFNNFKTKCIWNMIFVKDC